MRTMCEFHATSSILRHSSSNIHEPFLNSYLGKDHCTAWRSRRSRCSAGFSLPSFPTSHSSFAPPLSVHGPETKVIKPNDRLCTGLADLELILRFTTLVNLACEPQYRVRGKFPGQNQGKFDQPCTKTNTARPRGESASLTGQFT